MQDLTSNWDQTTKNCVQQYSDKKAKLWSFEVKSLINSSNVHKSFFQAVSNSSWANYGYLVAVTLMGADTTQELSASFSASAWNWLYSFGQGAPCRKPGVNTSQRKSAS
ncbi:MAG: hypothetical protein MRQ07_01770 [Candidatus Midichloria sp.]|nr:hypothetical protein [Candidatus Midichloria sp.]